METPSFSDSDRVSLSEEKTPELSMEQLVMKLCDRVTQIEHTQRIMYSMVAATRRIVKRNLSVILDSNDRNFEKMMLGFRAIQQCWDMSAHAQMKISEAVDDFQELSGQL